MDSYKTDIQYLLHYINYIVRRENGKLAESGTEIIMYQILYFYIYISKQYYDHRHRLSIECRQGKENGFISI